MSNSVDEQFSGINSNKGAHGNLLVASNIFQISVLHFVEEKV